MHMRRGGENTVSGSEADSAEGRRHGNRAYAKAKAASPDDWSERGDAVQKHCRRFRIDPPKFVLVARGSRRKEVEP
jgi:hypothetical protein